MGTQTVPRETRSKPFKVNLTPSMHEKLTHLAARFGMSPNALATLAIAEYVANKTAGFEAQKEVMEKLVMSVAPQLQPLIDALTADLNKKEDETC